MKVLAVGAHPDDVELYAGGLVAALTQDGAEVVLCDLTAGAMATRGTPDRRALEAEEAGRILGAASRECLGLPDGGLDGSDPAQVRELVEALRRHRPRLILAPWEVDLHPDHCEAARLVRRARFLARLARLPAGGDPCRPGSVLFYEQKIPFEPDLVVDITRVRERKLEAVRAFASQFTRPAGDAPSTEISEPAFHEVLEARSRVHGARIGVMWGEGYRTEGPLPVREPLLLLSPEAPS